MNYISAFVRTLLHSDEGYPRSVELNFDTLVRLWLMHVVDRSEDDCSHLS